VFLSYQIVPITGQGGNTALETAAALTNGLVKTLQSICLNRLSLSEITSVFETVQTLRVPRAWNLMKEAHRRQKLEAMDTPELKAIAEERVPQLKLESMYRQWVKLLTPAVSLHMLDISARPRRVPFQDELSCGQTDNENSAKL
jgi:2-polyprenyl-6-methoxyphenol hydroxylase-like FAD-dependent oxidoreductase